MNPQTSGEKAPRPLLAIGVVALAFVMLAAVAWLLTRSDSDEVAATTTAAPTTTAPTDEPTATTAAAEPEYDGTVGFVGTAFPPAPQQGSDEAVGMTMPVITGPDLNGDKVVVGGDGEPKLVVAVAHWCPHCQSELPQLVELADDDGRIGGVEVVVLSTFATEQRSNYPPEAWIDSEGWQGRTLLDDENSTLGDALGLAAVPTWLAVEADGTLLLRYSGGLPPDIVEQLAGDLVDA